MRFEYDLSENDFLAFQLYSASKSAAIKKRLKISRLILGLSAAAFAVFFFIAGQPWLGLYFVFMALLMAVFYPAYFKWFSKRQYRRYIQRNYADRIGIREKVTLTPKSIVAEDNIGEAKLGFSDIDRITETGDYFFVLIDGSALIIPKAKLEDVNQLRKELRARGLKVEDETDWKW